MTNRNSTPKDHVVGIKAAIEVAFNLLKRGSFEHSPDRITAEITIERLEEFLVAKDSPTSHVMGSDVVKRLRNPPFGTETSERNLMASAADEIEHLRGDADRRASR